MATAWRCSVLKIPAMTRGPLSTRGAGRMRLPVERSPLETIIVAFYNSQYHNKIGVDPARAAGRAARGTKDKRDPIHALTHDTTMTFDFFRCP